MKVYIYIALALTLACSACVNNIEELPYNIFDDYEAQLFNITEWHAHPIAETTTTVFFETNFDINDYPDITRFNVHYDTPEGVKMQSIFNVKTTNYFYIHFFESDFPYCFEFEAEDANGHTSRRDSPICPQW